MRRQNIWALICVAVLIGAAPQGKGMKGFKKPTDAELKKRLTPEQYDVTQKEGTEPPFHNAYWDNKKEGIYVDVVSGEPLFGSLDKFDSETGWPSFTQSLEPQNLVQKKDKKILYTRIEVRSKEGDSHLGHVFKDGPPPTGLRYCINSSALRFVPVEKLQKEGYEKYLSLFQEASSEKKSVWGSKNKQAVATLAGGCFWGVEDIIRKLPGVLEITVGYTGGITKNPTYEQIKKGNTGHAEAVQVFFDPEKLSYEEILNYFFRLHDPTTFHRQGNDVGSQYRSAIFYHDDEQRKIALKVKEQIEKSGKWKDKIVTEIVPAQEFYKAEDYHQKYLQKNPGGYTCHYLRD